MSDHGCTLFDTPLGLCGLAWGPQGIRALQLPEASEDLTWTRLRGSFPQAERSAPPEAVRQAIEAIAELLNGKARDLQEISLDMDRVPAFHRRVYEAAREILPGQTLTYGQLAARLGQPGSARAVGQALGRNPFPIIVPCHRILAAGGRPGGFSAPGGLATKFQLLAIEGAAGAGEPDLFQAAGLSC